MEGLSDNKAYIQKLKQKYEELTHLIASVLEKPLVIIS